MRKGREEGASLLNLHPCSCFFYILTSSISLLRQHCCIGLGELCKPTMGTKMKVKGICKGFNKYISQMFVVKEHEMQIGYPTDVKHVAHIGWDSQSSNAPSWMNEFKTTSDFSSTSLNNLCDDPSWSSQDFEHSMRRNQQGSDQNSKDESTTTRTTATTTTTTVDLPNAPKQKRKKIKSSFSLKKSSSSSTSSRSSSTTKLQPKTSFATSSMISEVETTVPVLATRSNKLGLL